MNSQDILPRVPSLPFVVLFIVTRYVLAVQSVHLCIFSLHGNVGGAVTGAAATIMIQLCGLSVGVRMRADPRRQTLHDIDIPLEVRLKNSLFGSKRKVNSLCIEYDSGHGRYSNYGGAKETTSPNSTQRGETELGWACLSETASPSLHVPKYLLRAKPTATTCNSFSFFLTSQQSRPAGAARTDTAS